MTSRPQLDPVMVASYTDGTWAIWQVETDPEATPGDFSGAWIIGPDGIQGFAATAEWIDGRDDPTTMLRTIVRYPVIPTDEATEKALAEVPGMRIVDFGEVELASEREKDKAKQEFSAESPGKKQPAWGTFPPLEPIDGEGPAALSLARGLHNYVAAWNAFDKVRKRRLESHKGQNPSGLPGL